MRHWASDHNEDGPLKTTSYSAKDYERSEKNKTITFYIDHVTGSDDLFLNSFGPVLDDAAPCSGIGLEEFKMVQLFLLPRWFGTFDALPGVITDRPNWQYASGEHAREPKRIIGSVLVIAFSTSGMPVHIRHLTIEGS
ncbi:unnamed protein product [Agarophyton chilense]